MAAAVAATLAFTVVEALAGWFGHSLALLSDAVHNLTDAAPALELFHSTFYDPQDWQNASMRNAVNFGQETPYQASMSSYRGGMLGVAQANADTERALIEHCRAQLIKWSCPREIEFRAELPKTRVGKIDYKLLVQEHAARHDGAS